MKRAIILLCVILIWSSSSQVIASSKDMSEVVKSLMDSSTEISANVYIGGQANDEHRLRWASLEENVLTVSINADVIYMAKAYSLTDYMIKFDGWAKMVTKQIAAYYVRDLFKLDDSILKVVFEIWIPIYVDRYGNIEEQPAGTFYMERDTYDKVVWDNITVQMIADLFEDDWAM